MSKKVTTRSPVKRDARTGEFVANQATGYRAALLAGKKTATKPVRGVHVVAHDVRGRMVGTGTSKDRGFRHGVVKVVAKKVLPAAVRQNRGDLLAAVHENMAGLHAEGLLSKTTMREFDELCLEPVGAFEADEIVAIRESAAVSPAIFAKYFNVSTSTISKWEQGEKRPNGLGRKLLDLVRRKGLDALA